LLVETHGEQLTNSVDVRLDIRLIVPTGSEVGYIVVYDHVDLLNIDTSSDDIGSDENFGLAVPESIEDTISLVGHLVSVE
jgi:hypothetical protein